MLNKTRNRFALTTSALFMGALCLSPVAAPRQATERFPTPSEGMVIAASTSDEGERQPDLFQLLQEFGRVTGEHIIVSNDTKSVLKATLSGLLTEVVVEPEDVYEVFESVLIANRFVVTDLKRGEPRMLVVASLDSPARSNVRGNARFVPIDEVERYEKHPAMLIQTVISFSDIDVRTMGNSMRAMVVDPNTMQLIPIPEAKCMILTGFGPTINELVETLRAIDEAASFEAERQAALRKAAPEQPSGD